MTPPLRVAIADDDRWMQHLLSETLRRLGHDVVAVANDGVSLVEKCAATRPDVVITDNLMPNMHGIDAAAAIYKRRPIPIILLSGYCDRDLVLDAEQKHVAVYLVKPVTQEHLEAALAKCMSEASADAEKEDAAGMDVVRSSGTLYRSQNESPYRPTLRLPR